MTATNETYLPTYEDLYVPPLNLTSSALKAGSHYFAQACDLQSKEFMLCRAEEKDPRKCLKYNKEVSKCANGFFFNVRKNCADSFTDYWKCLDNAPEGQMSYRFCRKTQQQFDACMKEKMNMDRQEVGYMSKVRLFNSDRPKPSFKTSGEHPTLAEIPKDAKNLPEAVDSLKKTGGGRVL